MDEQVWFSVARFAKRLGVDKMVVYRLIEEKAIEAIDLGTPKRAKLRINISQEALMAKRRVVSA